MKKPKQKEPRPGLTLFILGLLLLGAGYGLSYILEEQTPVGRSADHAHLALAAGVVLCGIAWIAAWAKSRG